MDASIVSGLKVAGRYCLLVRMQNVCVRPSVGELDSLIRAQPSSRPRAVCLSVCLCVVDDDDGGGGSGGEESSFEEETRRGKEREGREVNALVDLRLC